MIPEKTPVQWFEMKRVLAHGKPICAASLAEDHMVNQILSQEADLQTWHIAPFEGPTSRWPALEYHALQHARGRANLIENRRNEELRKGGK